MRNNIAKIFYAVTFVLFMISLLGGMHNRHGLNTYETIGTVFLIISNIIIFTGKDDKKNNVKKSENDKLELSEKYIEGASVKEALDNLKRILDKNNELVIADEHGNKLKVRCKFNKPATEKEIDKILKKTGWIFPKQYREFLLLHNGADFFIEKESPAFHLNSLDEILEECKFVNNSHKNYSIGSYNFGFGLLIIRSDKLLQSIGEYMFLEDDDETIDFHSDFLSWLNKNISNKGEFYWDEEID